MINRREFYNALRTKKVSAFGSRLSQDTVNGIEGIIDAWETHGDGRIKLLAWALATARGEVGRDMVPVREGFKKTDSQARTYVRANYGHKDYSKPTGPYRHVYYGRGQVQLTWHDNYIRSSTDAGVDLEKYPDKMLDPKISARVMIRGLIDGRWNGAGKGYGYYLPDDNDDERDDLKNVRRTVNVTDRWREFGDFYKQFLGAIRRAGFEVKDEEGPTLPEDKKLALSLLERLMELLKSIFGVK